jgi:putative transposase
MNSSFFDRHSVRIPGYDYTTPGYYFITINSFHRERYFGHLDGENFTPSSIGEIILDCWVKIPQHFPNASCDVFILMPDHFHGIIKLIAKSMYGHEFEDGHDISCPYGGGQQDINQEAFAQPVPGSVPTIIRTFKAAVTRMVGKPVWQRGYYEHIIRDYEDLDMVRGYIETQYLRTTK